MNRQLSGENATFMDRLKAAVNSFGLPRLIIACFLLLLFIAAPFVGADFATQITNTVNRFSWNAILVLAMVPMIHSGCGLNFGLPLGIISGLLGATLSIELGFTGPMSFVMAIVIATPFALLLGGDWLEQSASGLARYLLIGYVIGALIVIALTLLYTWDKVLKLVLMLLGKLPHTPKWDERREKWANSLTELNREAKKVLLVPSIRVKGIAVSLVKLFVLYSIPYAALRLVGCTALNFAQAQLLASLMLLITSALPNVAGVGPMEFAFLLLFAPWADTAIASSALVLYRVATYFFPFLLSVIVFLREEKKSLKGFDAQSA